MLTSASDHALPPPVEEFLRGLVAEVGVSPHPVGVEMPKPGGMGLSAIGLSVLADTGVKDIVESIDMLFYADRVRSSDAS